MRSLSKDNLSTVLLLLALLGIPQLAAAVQPNAQTNKYPHSSSSSNQHAQSHGNISVYNLRGGAAQPSNRPGTRTFWSAASSNKQQQQKQQQPTSFQQSQQQQQKSLREVTVTDVTDEMKTQERQKTKEEIDSFLTRDSRNTFIARVYAILTGQLLMVALSVLLFGKYPIITQWMMTKGKFVPWASILISTITVVFMSVSERARQISPLKWQLLAIFSIAEAIVVGLISSFYKSKTVMSAAMSTAVATISVTLYTVWNKDSKRDLSQWGAGLSSMGMIFVCYGIVHLLSQSGILPPEFLPYNEMVYSFLGTSLFTMYLAYHTRLIVSGKHSKYQLNEKDYVFGAVLLYNDIITIFLYMLRFMGGEDRN